LAAGLNPDGSAKNLRGSVVFAVYDQGRFDEVSGCVPDKGHTHWRVKPDDDVRAIAAEGVWFMQSGISGMPGRSWR
jgi:hypothetical protein